MKIKKMFPKSVLIKVRLPKDSIYLKVNINLVFLIKIVCSKKVIISFK